MYRQRSSILLTMATMISVLGCGDPKEFPTGSQVLEVDVSRSPIIDGRRSEVGDFPSTGALVMTLDGVDGRQTVVVCSGTLIARDVVLTAAHCTLGDAFFAYEIEGLNAAFFFTFHQDLTHLEDSSGRLPPRTIRVSHQVVYPGYAATEENLQGNEDRDPGTGLRNEGDLALLYLEEAVNDIEPVEILKPDLAHYLRTGSDVLVAGYGQQHRAHDANDPAVKNHGPSYIHAVGQYEFQVGDRAHRDETAPKRGLATKCYGDSGGPTYLDIGGRRYVAGVTSRGFDQEPDCDVAGIDTRVDAFADWILSTMHSGCVNELRVAALCDPSKGDGEEPAQKETSIQEQEDEEQGLEETAAEGATASSMERSGHQYAARRDTGGCNQSPGHPGAGWLTVLIGLAAMWRRDQGEVKAS